MPAERFHTSRPTESVLPRAQSGYTREYIHGPLQPMQYDEPPSFTARFCYGVCAIAVAYGLYHVARALGLSTWWFL